MTFIQRFLISCLVALVLGAAVLFAVWQRVEETTAAVQTNDRAERLVSTSDALLAEAVAMETGARSYIITGDSLKLDLFARNVGQVMLTLKQLHTLSEPISVERAGQLAFLDSVLDKKILEANQAILMRREQGIKIAAYVIIKGKAANAMGTVTAVLQSIQRTERAAREADRAQLPEKFRAAAFPVLYGFAAVLLVLFIGMVWAITAQRSALKPILAGIEQFVLGDLHHRVVAKAPEAKPIAAALNALGEQLRSAQGTAHRSEDLYADIFYATPEAISVWRSARNGYGQIVDFECVLANPAWNAAYKTSAAVSIGSRLQSWSPDLRDLHESLIAVTEKQQPLALHHTVNGAQYRLTAAKVRDGVLIRLSGTV